MALGDDYITVGELKNRLRIEDSVDDALLTVAVAASTDAINHHCGRDFNQAETATARRARAISPGLAIVADFYTTDDLVVATDNDGDGVFETVWDSSDFDLEPFDGVVNGVEGWPFWRIRAVGGLSFPTQRRAGIQVTAKWGWSSVPAGVVSAAYIIAEDIARLKDTAFGVGGYSEYGRIRARENPHAAVQLRPFRRDSVKVA